MIWRHADRDEEFPHAVLSIGGPARGTAAFPGHSVHYSILLVREPGQIKVVEGTHLSPFRIRLPTLVLAASDPICPQKEVVCIMRGSRVRAWSVLLATHGGNTADTQ